jgi:TPP-dependent pyruvate/acetoin dehydrogenase alpha subunit
VSLTAEELLDLHRRMVRIRCFEEAAGRLAEAARLPGFLHLYVGQEAVAAGVCSVLDAADQITSTHRGHGHLVAKGGEFRPMLAELMGRSTGYCGGKGGSMHISDLDLGMLGANGIVGAGAPIAVGAAFTNRYRGNGRVAVSFFGDGASNIGAVHEAANLAAALRLPVVFVCENNEYAEFTPRSATQRIADVADRAAGYGMPGTVVDGMDVLAVRAAASEAVDRARAGEGPTLLEAKTYRYYDHHGVKGLGVPYRDDAEVEAMKQRDPIAAFEAHLSGEGVLDPAGAAAVWDGVRGEIADAEAFAEASPPPDPSVLLTDVYTVAGEPAR